MSFCNNCGSQIEPNSRFCSKCGTPSGAVAPTRPVSGYPVTPYNNTNNSSNALGIVGFILSFVALFLLFVPIFDDSSVRGILFFVSNIAAMTLSIVGRSQAKQTGAPTGLATAGIVMSSINFAIIVIVILLVLVMFASYSHMIDSLF